jgi:hypothetical protein
MFGTRTFFADAMAFFRAVLAFAPGTALELDAWDGTTGAGAVTVTTGAGVATPQPVRSSAPAIAAYLIRIHASCA